MRVGIATLAHDNDNYGGAFQALATQEWLRRAGHEPVLLDTGPVRRVPWIRYPGEIFNHPLRKIQENRRRNTFIPFWERHFAFDPCGHRGFDRFVDAPTPCDAYLCGSDQVWASADVPSPKRDFYFLNFGVPDVPRVAYAASIGAPDFPEAAKPDVARLLARFAAVGMREESGAEAVRRLGRPDARWVCDPTLLHSRDFWDILADAGSGPWPARMLFAYGYRWATTLPADQAVAALERGLGLRTRIPFSHRPLQNLGRTCAISPWQWLNALRAAEGVVTNSFHCVVFSILFRRPFVALPLAGRYARMNARLESLLERLGLRDRLLRDGADIVACMAATIDWAAAERRLAAWREESAGFLRQALGGTP